MGMLRLTKNSGNAQRQAVRRWGNWWGLQELNRGCFPGRQRALISLFGPYQLPLQPLQKVEQQSPNPTMSFVKRNTVLSARPGRPLAQAAAEKQQLAPGIRPSPLDGRSTTSTGTASLDQLL